MPLISIVIALYLTATLAGFAGWLFWVIGGMAIAAALILIRRADASLLALPVLAVLGAAAAHQATIDRQQCTEHARAPLVATLDGDASGGGFVAAHLTSCGAPVALVAAGGDDKGTAIAGSTVRVTGDLTRSAKGLVLQRASMIVLTPPPLAARARRRVGLSIDRVFGADAPIARALIVADKSQLTPELKERFSSAGLAHVLAISGLHVAVIVAMAELVLRLMRFPAGVRPAASFGIVVVYIVMIGAPPAAVRAGVMLGVRATSRVMQRPTSPWAMLALGAAAPVMNPWIALEAGFQLSVVGVAALIAGSRVPARLPIPRRPKWRRTLIAAIVASTIATIATAPLVAQIFGKFTPIAPFSTVIAMPVVALLQPVLFAALVVSRGPVASFLAGAAHPLIVLLKGIALVASSVPGGSVPVSPTPMTGAIAATLSVAFLVACASRRPGRPLILALTCAVVLAWPPVAQGGGSGLTELHMIDVGQGDAIALRTPHGQWVLFDAGPAWLGGDAGRATVVPYLKRQGGSLAAFVESHPHADHIGGAAAVLTALHPSAYYDPGYAAPTTTYRGSLTAAVAAHAVWHRVHPGDSLALDGVTITFLAPDSVWALGLSDPNNASTIALIRAGDVRFLLVGDAERSEEDWLIQHDSSLLHADVLKVGHHGSSTSSTVPFLEAVHPRLALVSVGAGNKYGHPSPETMRSIAEHGAQVLRTDLVGTVVVRTNGHTITVEAGGDRWEVQDVPRRQ